MNQVNILHLPSLVQVWKPWTEFCQKRLYISIMDINSMDIKMFIML